MDRIDRLLQKAKDDTREWGVHIIRNGNCVQCGGVCIGENLEGAVVILDDVPKGFVVKIPTSLVYESAELVRRRDKSKMIPLTLEEQQAILEEQRRLEAEQKDTPYRRLFGYG